MWRSFTYIEPADHDSPAFVATELLHGGVQVDDPERVAECDQLWSRLWSAALSGEDAVSAIRAAQEDLRERGRRSCKTAEVDPRSRCTRRFRFDAFPDEQCLVRASPPGPGQGAQRRQRCR